MAGIVVDDLNGGDFAVKLVDDALWAQIQRIPEKVEKYCSEHEQRYYGQVFTEWVGWLALDDSDEEEPCPKPDCCPDREGKTLKTWYCQAPVIEDVDIDVRVFGIVFLLGG
jgi:hypothetical protein